VLPGQEVKEDDFKPISVYNGNNSATVSFCILPNFRRINIRIIRASALTGIVQEDTMLVLFPDHPDPKYREVLILVRPNEMKEKWDGKRLRAEEGKNISGIGTVIWLDASDAILQTWIAAHIPADSGSEFDAGWAALAAQLLAEMDKSSGLPD
jgi:hypothetical protein